MNGSRANSSQIHTISAYVANKPGVLARVALTFARRGYNIDSLVVSAGRDGRYSRMTITASGDPAGLDQIIKQMNKLVDVIHCTDHTGENTVIREMALIKVRITPSERSEAFQIAEHFGAKSLDLTERSAIFMVTGASDKLDAFINMLAKFDVVELVRTGKVVMARGEEET
ncbi:MAG TPA: acetolactate synthase small subunit [Chloroflexi bacterium]|nr:MAG: acetolactate synthase small subunit [Verrucomicrobiota bacterium]HDD23832.1 acetolactate synthase small subunit [Chloroflexota bacterium]